MSSGYVHVKASLMLAAGFSVGALVSQDVRMLECVVGSLAGIVLSPDLDVDAGNISNKIIKKRVGWFAEKAWRFFWRGYAKSFKHGQFASHFPVVSTLIRVMYVYFWVILLPHLLIYLLWLPGWNLSFVLSFYLTMFFRDLFLYGLIASDTIHYFLDILTKEKTRG